MVDASLLHFFFERKKIQKDLQHLTPFSCISCRLIAIPRNVVKDQNRTRLPGMINRINISIRPNHSVTSGKWAPFLPCEKKESDFPWRDHAFPCEFLNESGATWGLIFGPGSWRLFVPQIWRSPMDGRQTLIGDLCSRGTTRTRIPTNGSLMAHLKTEC